MSTVSTERPPEVEGVATFDSLSPATGEVLASYPIAGQQALSTRRSAGPARRARGGPNSGSPAVAAGLSAWRRLLANRAEELAEIVAAETGKPKADAVLEISSRSIIWRGPRSPQRRCWVREGRRRPAGGQPGGDAGIPAAGCHRRDRALELSRLYADGFDRLRVSRRECGRFQAQRVHPGRGCVAG